MVNKTMFKLRVSAQEVSLVEEHEPIFLKIIQRILCLNLEIQLLAFITTSQKF